MTGRKPGTVTEGEKRPGGRRARPDLLTLLRSDTRPDNPHTRASGLGEPVEPQRGNSGDTLLNRLLRLVEGAINRIQLQQSVSVTAEDPQRLAYQIDLPIQLDECHPSSESEHQHAEGLSRRLGLGDPGTGL